MDKAGRATVAEVLVLLATDRAVVARQRENILNGRGSRMGDVSKEEAAEVSKVNSINNLVMCW